MGAIAPTFKLTEEPYSNPDVAAGRICLHSGHLTIERLERFAHEGGHV
jgi:hypothetical protein